jgi:apolipoprotein N-acyltransferase
MGAGILLALSFPNFDVAGLAWIAPALILTAALGTSGKQTFRIGYVAGLMHYLVSLSWLLQIPLAGFPILGWIALSAFLALFTGTWTWLCLGFQISNHKFEIKDLRSAVMRIAEMEWGRRIAWTLACAAAWAAMEMIIARIFGGFPWNLLGSSQVPIVPLIQIASAMGIYGVSFLVVWGSISLLAAASVILGRPGMRSVWMAEILFPMTAVLGCFIFGYHAVTRPAEPARTVNVTLIQPAIPQTLIWNETNDAVRFDALLRLSEEALTNRTDVLIWPEAAVPRPLRYDERTFTAIAGLAVRHHTWVIVGSDDADMPTNSTEREYYNASFLISPEGELMSRYKKRSLVMFGEYIPLAHWIPFIKALTPWMPGSFTPGDRPVPFVMDIPSRDGEPGVRVKTSVLICFEDVFAHSAREYVDEDTDFLVNITNDGWFGEGAAQRQHAAAAAFRSVENHVPLVRCSNTGLTCWIDAQGRFQQVFHDAQERIYGPGFMTAKIPVLNGGTRAPTFYRQHGDWFGWSCVVLALMRFGQGWYGRKRVTGDR